MRLMKNQSVGILTAPSPNANRCFSYPWTESMSMTLLETRDISSQLRGPCRHPGCGAVQSLCPPPTSPAIRWVSRHLPHFSIPLYRSLLITLPRYTYLAETGLKTANTSPSSITTTSSLYRSSSGRARHQCHSPCQSRAAPCSAHTGWLLPRACPTLPSTARRCLRSWISAPARQLTLSPTTRAIPFPTTS